MLCQPIPCSIFTFWICQNILPKVERDGKTEPGRGGWPQTETEQPGQGSPQVMMMRVVVVTMMMIMMIIIMIVMMV